MVFWEGFWLGCFRAILPLSLGVRPMAREGGKGGEEWAEEAVASIEAQKSLILFFGPRFRFDRNRKLKYCK